MREAGPQSRLPPPNPLTRYASQEDNVADFIHPIVIAVLGLAPVCALERVSLET